MPAAFDALPIPPLTGYLSASPATIREYCGSPNSERIEPFAACCGRGFERMVNLRNSDSSACSDQGADRRFVHFSMAFGSQIPPHANAKSLRETAATISVASDWQADV